MVRKDDIIERLRGDGVVELLEHLGLEVRVDRPGRDYAILCPWHDDTHPSCTVFTRDGGRTWLVKCFSCEAHGDLFHLVGKVRGLGSPSDKDAFVRIMEETAKMMGVADVPGEGREQAAQRRAEQARKNADRHARAEKFAQEQRQKSIEEAGKAWQNARGHSTGRAAAYFAERGVPITALPGGTMPAALRFDPQAYRRYYTHEMTQLASGKVVKATREEHVPAIICGAFDHEKTLTMVQRIYLDPAPGAAGKITYGFSSKSTPDKPVLLQKAALGSSTMEWVGSVPLGQPGSDGILILVEGIETGVAVQAAMGDKAQVRALISADGLRKYRLHPSQAAPELCDGSNGWVRHVVVAGDLDKSKAGQKAAAACASSLLKEWGERGLRVTIALATADVAPTLVTADGKIAGGEKSVDWLDVYRAHGPEAVVKGMMVYATPGEIIPDEDNAAEVAASDGHADEPPPPPDAPAGAASPGDGSGGDEWWKLTPEEEAISWAGGMLDHKAAREQDRLIRRQHLHPDAIGRRMLVRCFRPPAPPPPLTPESQTFLVRRYGSTWWQYPKRPTSMQRWRRLEDEPFKSEVGARLCELWREAPTDSDPERVLPLLSGNARGYLDSTLQAITRYAYVPPEVSMPAWLPPSFSGDGRATWEPMSHAEDVSQEECTPYRTLMGKPLLATDVIAVRQGLLDLTAWCNTDLPLKERLRILPHTPRYFNHAVLPHALDVDGLLEAEAEGDLDYWKRKMPTVMQFLADSSGGDDDWISVAQEMLAYVMTPDRSLQVILWMQGLPGSGKTTFVECLMWAVVGEDNICPCDTKMLVNRFAGPAMLGPLVYAIDELRVDGHTETGMLLDRILSISGGARQMVEDKSVSLKFSPKVRMTGCFVMNLNKDPNWRGAEATLRRMRVLPFQHVPLKPDPTLWPRLRAEASTTFMWALHALPRLRKNKGFTPLKSGTELLDEIRRKISIVQAFVADCCVVGEGHECETSMLRELFYAYCREEGDDRAEDYFTDSRFGSDLKDIKGIRREANLRRPSEKVPSSHKGEHETYRVYTGVRPLLRGETPEVARTRPKSVVAWDSHALPDPRQRASTTQPWLAGG